MMFQSFAVIINIVIISVVVVLGIIDNGVFCAVKKRNIR